MNKLRAFLRDERGATSIEYALIAGCIFVVIVAAIRSVGSNLSAQYTNVANNLN